jgi:hypothetical protein
LAVYLHLGPYSRYIIASIERRLAALDPSACRQLRRSSTAF